ncbi:MAG: ClbS/DfsB family four-helix bundle protein [Thermomicrobiales bacterium]
MESNTVEVSPRNPEELIARHETSWQSWKAATDGIPDDRMREPVTGHWSAKDLLGHVAFWEDWVIDHCQRLLAGEPEPEEDLDAVNQGQVAASQETSVAAQRQYGDAAHARLMAFLRTIHENEVKFPRLVEALEWETYKHYDEHAAEIRAWREREGF